jgi:hypothetical protein
MFLCDYDSFSVFPQSGMVDFSPIVYNNEEKRQHALMVMRRPSEQHGSKPDAEGAA